MWDLIVSVPGHRLSFYLSHVVFRRDWRGGVLLYACI